MKYARIHELRQVYPVAAMCRVLGVSESGCHAWHKRPLSPRAQENARLEVEIKAAHDRTRQTYGPERLQADLADNGIRVGVHRIKRIRKQLGLRCRQKRRFKATHGRVFRILCFLNLLGVVELCFKANHKLTHGLLPVLNGHRPSLADIA